MPPLPSRVLSSQLIPNPISALEGKNFFPKLRLALPSFHFFFFASKQFVKLCHANPKRFKHRVSDRCQP